MSNQVTKSVSVDFPSGFSPSVLLSDIINNIVIVSVVEYIEVNGDVINILFTTIPSQPELDELDALILAHDPVYTPSGDLTLDSMTAKTGTTISVLSDLDVSTIDIVGLTIPDLSSHISNTSNPHEVTLEQARTANNLLAGDVDMGGHIITNISQMRVEDNGSAIVQEDGLGVLYKKVGNENLYWVGDSTGLEKSLTSINGFETASDTSSVQTGSGTDIIAASIPIDVLLQGDYMIHWSARIGGNSVINTINLPSVGIIGQSRFTTLALTDYVSVSGFEFLPNYIGGENLEFLIRKNGTGVEVANISHMKYYIVRVD